MKLMTLGAAFVLLIGPAFGQDCDPALAPLPQKQADETSVGPDSAFEDECLALAKMFASMMSLGAAQQVGLPVSSASPRWGRLIRVDLAKTSSEGLPRLVCYRYPLEKKVTGAMYVFGGDRCRTIAGFTIYPPGVAPSQPKN